MSRVLSVFGTFNETNSGVSHDLCFIEQLHHKICILCDDPLHSKLGLKVHTSHTHTHQESNTNSDIFTLSFITQVVSRFKASC